MEPSSAPRAHLIVRPSAQAGSGIRSYEELEGGEGRVLTFRPHRYTPMDLAPLVCSVRAGPGGGEPSYPVRDVSRSGVAFEVDDTFAVPADNELPLSIWVDAHVLWHGSARIRGLRHGGDGRRVVAASLGERLIDGDELRLLREVWLPLTAGLRLAEQPWRAPGETTFPALVAELRAYLEELRVRLARFEATLPWSVADGPTSASRTAVVGRVRNEVSTDVVHLLRAIDDAWRRADPAAARAHRELAWRQLGELVTQAPWLARARGKPLGYAGDFEVMNYLYERDFEGPTLFARVVGFAFMQAAAARGVRCRKDLMKRSIAALIERRGGAGEPVRVLSIAAGPARELQELLRELPALPAPLHVVLFDQDKRALDHAFQRLRPLADARFPGRVHIDFLNESVKRLLRDPRLFEDIPPFDLVYSCGLFDYFHEATAVRLARNLCAAAASDGLVLIGNMADHPERWVMDLLLEWPLLYRSRAELLDIGHRAAPNASGRIVEEESGVNPFVALSPGG